MNTRIKKKKVRQYLMKFVVDKKRTDWRMLRILTIRSFGNTPIKHQYRQMCSKVHLSNSLCMHFEKIEKQMKGGFHEKFNRLQNNL